MTSRTRTALGWGAAALILTPLIVGVFLASRTPAFPPLPNPNGYDDLLNAGRLATDRVGDFPDLSLEDLRALLVTNAEALRLCRLGLSRTCSVPTEASIANFAEWSSALAKMKRLAQLLAAEGRLAEMENRDGDAARSYAEAMQLGDSMSHGGFLIHRLVGIALEAIGGTRLAKVVPKLSPEQGQSTLLLLDAIDATGVTWDEVNHNENLFCRHELRKIRNLPSAVAGLWTSRPVKKRTKERHNAAVAHRRLLMLELALRCYQAEAGRPPAALQDLCPKYVPHVPADPFSGAALVYKPEGTNWLLYSIGSDGVDSGGRSGGRGSQTGDILYSSPW